MNLVSQPAVSRLPTEILLSVFDFSTSSVSSSLCAELNEGHCQVTDDIPPSLWPDVFDVRGGPWVIGQVCRVWRSTALSNPSLWCSFYVGQPPSSRDIAMQVLSTWILRSGNSLLNFRIIANALCDRPDGSELLRILSSVSRRWHVVEIANVNLSSTFWNELKAAGVGQNLPSLKELALLAAEESSSPYDQDFDPIVENGFFSTLPTLDSFVILDRFFGSPIIEYSGINLPWGQLTTYASTDFTDQAMVLRRARNLVRCSMLVDVEGIEEDEDWSPIILNRLRILRIYWSSWHIERDIDARKWSLIVTPVLEELSVMSDASLFIFPPFRLFSSVLRSSSCSLKSLELSGSAASEHDVLMLIEAASTIVRLRVWLDSPIQQFIIPCLDAKRDIPLAPLLEDLELGLTCDADIGALDMVTLVVIIRSRLSSDLHNPQNGVAALQSLIFVTQKDLGYGDNQFPPLIDVLQEEGLNVYVRALKRKI